jgi:hypothetical protein
MPAKAKRSEPLTDANGFYKSRRHQLLGIQGEVEAEQISLADALRDAAFVGAAEERDRILRIIRESGLEWQEKRTLTNAVAAAPLLTVNLQGAVYERDYGRGHVRYAVSRATLGPIWPYLIPKEGQHHEFAERDAREEFEPWLSDAALAWAKGVSVNHTHDLGDSDDRRGRAERPGQRAG